MTLSHPVVISAPARHAGRTEGGGQRLRLHLRGSGNLRLRIHPIQHLRQLHDQRVKRAAAIAIGGRAVLRATLVVLGRFCRLQSSALVVERVAGVAEVAGLRRGVAPTPTVFVVEETAERIECPPPTPGETMLTLRPVCHVAPQRPDRGAKRRGL